MRLQGMQRDLTYSIHAGRWQGGLKHWTWSAVPFRHQRGGLSVGSGILVSTDAEIHAARPHHRQRNLTTSLQWACRCRKLLNFRIWPANDGLKAWDQSVRLWYCPVPTHTDCREVTVYAEECAHLCSDFAFTCRSLRKSMSSSW